MRDVLLTISSLEDLKFIKPATTTEVHEAEKKLGIKFAEDYKEYVLEYGVISAKGVELTGVTDVERLDVVRVTQGERERNALLPENMYVIENIAIDGLVALQDTSGEIYTIRPNEAPQLFCSSLGEYLNQLNC